MSCSDDNPCYDIGMHEEAFGVQENSTVVSVIKTQRQYWSTSKIRGFNKLFLMNLKPRDFRAHKASRFIAESSH